ncbi:hypothetical protein HKBW3S09_01718 [Candidatus Hakubella thermalkaliphila]|uniref:Uncharacterized protein n=1 Tax=Candidatus Hakubella thermalkaliphila TaxID=2754717 RepID=A0A6V8NYC9_9ACTN|nr:hypothetical protein HKBW3S09_01718 [Candidatus Hakubella thermalkaliphila]
MRIVFIGIVGNVGKSKTCPSEVGNVGNPKSYPSFSTERHCPQSGIVAMIPLQRAKLWFKLGFLLHPLMGGRGCHLLLLQDLQPQILEVVVIESSPSESFDLIDLSLGNSIANTMLPKVKNRLLPMNQRPGGFNHLLDSTGLNFSEPVLRLTPCLFAILTSIDGTEHLLRKLSVNPVFTWRKKFPLPPGHKGLGCVLW